MDTDEVSTPWEPPTVYDIERYNADPFYAAPVTVSEWLDKGHAVSELPHWNMVRDAVIDWVLGDGAAALIREQDMLARLTAHGVAAMPRHRDGYYPEGFDIAAHEAGSWRRVICQLRHSVELLGDEDLMHRALATLSDDEHTSLAASVYAYSVSPEEGVN